MYHTLEEEINQLRSLPMITKNPSPSSIVSSELTVAEEQGSLSAAIADLNIPDPNEEEALAALKEAQLSNVHS